jgi:molecular chaperone GrpE (heat shock protein)
MDDAFTVTETPIPVPPGAAEVNLMTAFVGMYVNRSALEVKIERATSDAHDAKRDILLAMLEIADALERLLARPVPTSDFETAYGRQRRSIEATQRLLAKKLAPFGVARYSFMGLPADPALADIEDVHDRDDLPDETIVDELTAAYSWHDETLRRGKVIVSHRTDTSA